MGGKIFHAGGTFGRGGGLKFLPFKNRTAEKKLKGQLAQTCFGGHFIWKGGGENLNLEREKLMEIYFFFFLYS